MTKVQDAFVLAWKRQREIQGFFNKHGLERVVVPPPSVSDEEFKIRWGKIQKLFFRPATKDLSYEDFMKALGQGNHWTVVDKEERVKIVWEPCEQGYWFWADVQCKSPRLRNFWNKMIQELKLNLFCLEEYVIVFYMSKVISGVEIDVSTCTWLRNVQPRECRGALTAGGCNGDIRVYDSSFTPPSFS